MRSPRRCGTRRTPRRPRGDAMRSTSRSLRGGRRSPSVRRSSSGAAARSPSRTPTSRGVRRRARRCRRRLARAPRRAAALRRGRRRAPGPAPRALRPRRARAASAAIRFSRSLAARRRKESPAADARDAQARGAHDLRRARQTDFGDLVAPHRDRRDAAPRAGVNRLLQRPRLDGVLVQREPRAIHQPMPAVAKHPRGALGGALLIHDQPGRVGELERARQVDHRTRALGAAEHPEVVLKAVQVGEEHDAGLVGERRRREQMARERHRRREDRVVARAVAVVERARARPAPPARSRRRSRAARRCGRSPSPAISSG